MFDIAQPPHDRERSSEALEDLESRTLLCGFGRPIPPPPPPAAADNLTAAADFDGDKKADLVSVSNAGDFRCQGPRFSIVQLQRGRGNGQFGAPFSIGVNAPASAVIAADFNNDQKMDVGVLSTAGNMTTLYILPGNGRGAVGGAVRMNLGTMPVADIAAGDINADGDPDLVAWDADNVWVCVNDGKGGFTAAVRQDNPFGDVAPAGLGDFFGDGRYELIGVGGTAVKGNMFYVQEGVFMLTFLVNAASDLPLDDKRVVMADVDGDGQQDLVALGNGSVNAALRVQDPYGNAAFGPWQTTQGPIQRDKALVADLNGDGKADVFNESWRFCFRRIGRVVLISEGDGTFQRMLF